MVTEHGEVLTVRKRDGSTVSIDAADVVASKPIPTSTRGKPPATGAGLARIAALGLPAVTVEHLGDWVLQASEGFTRRANAVVTCGSPGVSNDQAIARVVDFYAEHRLPPTIQVVVGSPIEQDLKARGWVSVTAEPVAAQIARVGDLVNRLRPDQEPGAAGPPAPETGTALGSVPEIELDVPLDESWLALYGPGTASSNEVRRVLTGPVSDGAGGSGAVTLARVLDPHASGTGTQPVPGQPGQPGQPGPTGSDPTGARPVVAIARASVTGAWLGLSVVVARSHRRRGLARAILRRLVDWGVEHHAGWAYLQVGMEHEDALGLCQDLGFRTDHTFRYYSPPTPPPRLA